jgi:hypothetical protein
MTSHSASRLRGSRPGGRLVEEQHLRPVDQGGSQVEPAPHAAGVGLGHPVGGLDQVEPLEQLVGPRGRPVLEPVEGAEQPQVLAAGEVLVDGGVLAGQADPAADGARPGDDVDAVDQRAAGVRAQQRGEHAHGGGLAGAVGPEQAEHGAALDGERDAVERPVGAEGDPHVLDDDGGCVGGHDVILRPGGRCALA